MIKKITNISVLAVTIALFTMLGSTVAFAQPVAKLGYLTDTKNEIPKSGFGLCWHTGSWTPALATPECDPEYAKKEPVKIVEKASEAAMAAVAPKPITQKITLSADTLFDFDKATLRPEGQAKLDDLVTRSKELNVEVMIATGHTDRIGSDEYNQRLSDRRAASVKAYLVNKGVEPARIYTEGKGKKQPVTGNECTGKDNRHNKKLLKCLQPDRRVEVEVIGVTTTP